MKPPTQRDDTLARRVAQRCPGLLPTTLELRTRYRWTLERIARALDLPGELALLRRCAAEGRQPGRCRVVCSRCRWTGERPRATCRLRPCPDCGGLVRSGRARGGRPKVAERLGVESTVPTIGHVSPEAWARLRGAGGRRMAEIAGQLLERWAAGLPIPAGWVPELGRPKRGIGKIADEVVVLNDVTASAHEAAE